jgi:hypothetical protein
MEYVGGGREFWLIVQEKKKTREIRQSDFFKGQR